MELLWTNVRQIESGPEANEWCVAKTPRQLEPDLSWHCTRETGHDGPHVAHNAGRKPVAAWTDTEQEEF